MVLLAFVTLLLGLAVVGVVMKIRPADESSVSPCETAASAAIAFQAAVTRDIRRHAGLHADTRVFVTELRSLTLATCSDTQRFLVAAEQTVASLCADCAAELRRVRPRA